MNSEFNNIFLNFSKKVRHRKDIPLVFFGQKTIIRSIAFLIVPQKVRHEEVNKFFSCRLIIDKNAEKYNFEVWCKVQNWASKESINVGFYPEAIHMLNGHFITSLF